MAESEVGSGMAEPKSTSATLPVRLKVCGLRGRLAGPFDLTLRAGECVAITGASGSGKSLLLRMLAELDICTGEVRLDGRLREHWSAPQWRRQVMYCAAEAAWWAERVVDHFVPETVATARELLPRLGLAPEKLLASLAQLSTGERQRLALVRALALEPPVLLLDEPTGAVDEGATQRIEVVLRERLTRGVALLLVTHDLRLAARLASRRLLMIDGRLETE